MSAAPEWPIGLARLAQALGRDLQRASRAAGGPDALWRAGRARLGRALRLSGAELEEALRLRAAIEGGVLAEGAFLPSEAELCAQFGVSRITLRRAVSDLCAAGLLLRQQGRGTVVTRR